MDITFFLDGQRCKVSKLITLVICRTRAHNLYLRLVHCITSNSSYCRPPKSPLGKSNAGNNTTTITFFLDGRRCKVSKLITLVIRRTRAHNLYLRLVHCITSNSSYCIPLKSPLVKSNAGNNTTIITFFLDGHHVFS